MADISTGTVFGNRYVVQSQVGKGGMATVYRGVDTTLDRQVAIKVMLPQYASDPAFAQRFRQEARAAAALQNPYIVQVYDWGRDDATGTYFIIMEYLRGTDLKSGIISHGALAPKKVAQIGAQVCSALAVAHSHEIIHRDVKPQNIMILPNGDAKVMDFGIARAKNSHLTQTNSVLGTAHYVSPEQAQGKELGPTSDLYSLGVVMYEAATGKLPFEGDDAVSVALKQVNEQPVPPSRVNPNIDPTLEAIIMRLMLKDPSQRFQTADELRHVLNAYIQDNPLNIPPYSGGVTTVRQRNQQPTQMISANPNVTTRQSSAARTARMERPPARQDRMSAANTASQRAVRREDNRRRRAADTGKSTIIGIVAVLVVLGVLVAFGMTALNSCSTSTSADASSTKETTVENVTVPSVSNLTQQEAKNRLESYGLVLGTVTTESSNTVTQGKVISQSVAANSSVAKGTAVNIVISGGTDLISFSDIRGMTPDAATTFITSAGLTLVYDSSLDAYSDKYAEGTIVTYSPANQKVAKGSTVSYGLSKGVETVTVPDVVNWYYTDAENTLAASNLSYTEDWQYNSDYTWGAVISTSPSSGSGVSRSTSVTLTISQGGEPVTVGNYSGWALADAENALTALGLKYTTGDAGSAPSSGQSGTVAWNDPSDTQTTKGSTVTLYVYSDYIAPTVYVGSYVGWSASAAEADLTSLGMYPSTTYDMTPTSSELAYVVYYSEPAGQNLNTGTSVLLYAYGEYVEPEPEPEPSEEGTSEEGTSAESDEQ